MKFRKKPVVIEAVKVSDVQHDVTKRPDWLVSAIENKIVCFGGVTLGCSIKTLEGTMQAGYLDWLIQGVNGEIYPCKPDIFAKTYDWDPTLEEQLAWEYSAK